MALRVLSGLVFIPRGGSRVGSVEITFDPFELANASNDLFELRKRRQIGASGRFRARPASIVAARQFAMMFPFPHATNYKGRINDTVTRDSITISWSCTGGRVDQEEIPFMVVGEVPDPPAPAAQPARPDRPVRVHPSDKVPDRIRNGKPSGPRPPRKKS